MASMFYCDVCDKRDKTSVAIKFCSDCEDKLCSGCLDVHNAIKLCVDHHVVDVSIASLDVNKYCEKHADSLLEFYCSDHDVLCCRSCMAEDHRACGKLTPIEVSSKDIKSSNMFQDISHQINYLREFSSQMTKAVQNSKSLLKESKTNSIEKVTELKKQFLKRIDVLATECISQIDRTFSDISKKVESKELEVSKRVEIIQDTLTKFDLIVEHGSEKQIFMLLNSINTDIYKIDANLQELVPTLKTATIEVEEFDFSTYLKSIALVKIKERECDFKHKPKKQQQAQLKKKLHPAETKFHLENTVTFTDDKKMWISGMCVTDENRIILCNYGYGEEELVVLTNQGNFIQNIPLSNRPCKIAVESGTGSAWVTMPETSYLQVINTASLSSQFKVKAPLGCYGIAFVATDIALGLKSKFVIINKEGCFLKSIKLGSDIINSLDYSGNGLLYCCEGDSNIVHCVSSLDMVKVSSYTSDDFDGPVSASFDQNGNCYVLCYHSNNLHKLNADGTPGGIILQQDTGLDKPYCASFSRDFSNLFVSNSEARKILIFNCK